MTLKEQMTADLPTFFNVGEFADTVDIDGDEVVCVFDNEENPASSSFEGVTSLDFTIRVRTADFYTMPVVNQRMVIDFRPANVVRVVDDQGVLSIDLRWLDS